MKCDGARALRTVGFLLCVLLGLAFVACNGGAGDREPAGEATEGPATAGTPAATATPAVSPERGDGARGPALSTASPWPNPTVPTGEPVGTATPQTGRAEVALPTVSPEELPAIGGDPPREGEIDPCSLATKAEVEGIIEQKVPDVWRHAHFFRVCEYFTDPDVEPFGSAVIRLESGLSENEFEEEIDEIEPGEVGLPSAKALPGVGDAAYSIGPILWVCQESTMLVIVVGVRDRPDLDAAKELASIALRRLQ